MCRWGGPRSPPVGKNHHDLRAARPDRLGAALGARRLWRRPQAVELGHVDRGLPGSAHGSGLSVRRLEVCGVRVVVGELRAREAGAARQSSRRPRPRSGSRRQAEGDRWRGRGTRSQAGRRTRQGAGTLAAGPRQDRHLARPLVGEGVVHAPEGRRSHRETRDPIRHRGAARSRRGCRRRRTAEARQSATRSGNHRLPLRRRSRPRGRPLPRRLPRPSCRCRRASGPLRVHGRADRAARRLRHRRLGPRLRFSDGV